MTLAIGSTLIGVAIDYPILLLTNRVLAPTRRPTSRSGRVWIGALLGGMTTAAGFIALAWTSFPGVREMAVTSAAGILAALAVTPLRAAAACCAGARAAPALLARGAAGGNRALAWLGAPPAPLARRWRPRVAVCALGLPRLRWLDSLAASERRRPGAEGGDRSRTRPRLARRRGAPRHRERARRRARRCASTTRSPTASSARGGERPCQRGIVSLHAFLWSAELQVRNRAAVAAVPDLAGRTLAALAREGSSPRRSSRSARRSPRCTRHPTCHRCASADLRASPLDVDRPPFIVKLGERRRHPDVHPRPRRTRRRRGGPRRSARRAHLRSGSSSTRPTRVSAARRCKRSARPTL